MTPETPRPSPQAVEREAQRLERMRRLHPAPLRVVELRPYRDNAAPPASEQRPDPQEAA